MLFGDVNGRCVLMNDDYSIALCAKCSFFCDVFNCLFTCVRRCGVLFVVFCCFCICMYHEREYDVILIWTVYFGVWLLFLFCYLMLSLSGCWHLLSLF